MWRAVVCALVCVCINCHASECYFARTFSIQAVFISASYHTLDQSYFFRFVGIIQYICVSVCVWACVGYSMCDDIVMICVYLYVLCGGISSLYSVFDCWLCCRSMFIRFTVFVNIVQTALRMPHILSYVYVHRASLIVCECVCASMGEQNRIRNAWGINDYRAAVAVDLQSHHYQRLIKLYRLVSGVCAGTIQFFTIYILHMKWTHIVRTCVHCINVVRDVHTTYTLYLSIRAVFSIWFGSIDCFCTIIHDFFSISICLSRFVDAKWNFGWR